MVYRPPIHCVTYGPWGSGKSSFAATFPKPMVVLQRDPLGKEAPYLRRGLVHEDDPTMGDLNQLIYRVHSAKPPHAQTVQVELFLDQQIQRPTAHRAFQRRMATVCEEVCAGRWQTLVIDGITELEFGARKQAEYGDLKGAKDPRRWYAASTHDVEEVVRQAAALPCNVVIIAHIDDDYDEVQGCRVHSPAAPGKLRTRFGSGFPEMYVMHAMKPKPGEPVRYWLQTRTDQRCAASSVFLDAPDPCEPDYAKLWAAFDARKRPIITAAELDAGRKTATAVAGQKGDNDGQTV